MILKKNKWETKSILVLIPFRMWSLRWKWPQKSLDKNKVFLPTTIFLWWRQKKKIRNMYIYFITDHELFICRKNVELIWFLRQAIYRIGINGTLENRHLQKSMLLIKLVLILISLVLKLKTTLGCLGSWAELNIGLS